MPVVGGVSYSIAQPCLDLAAQLKAAGIANLGIEGDLAHQAGCGDHVPWECTGHFHWITAIDIGWGPVVNGVRLTPALLRQYLLPRLRAHTWEFYMIKYIITNYILNDTRPEYGLRDQKGGDGPDHMHISFLNSAIGKRCTLIQDFVAWVRAGMPDPVTFRPGSGESSGADMAMVTLSGDRTAVVVRGANKGIYVRVLAAGKPKTSWARVGSVVAGSGVDAATRTGDDLWIVALDPDDKSVRVISTANAEILAAPRVQDVGGKGLGSAPGISASGLDILITVAGVSPHPGQIYLKRWAGVTNEWIDWVNLDGIAG